MKREWLAPPSRPAFLRATWLWAPVTVATLATKAHKLVVVGGATALDVGSVFAPDLLALGAAWVLTMAAIDRRRAWARVPMVALAHLVAAAWGVLVGAEHAYFIVTGTVPDGYMAKEVLTRWEDARAAIGSELKPFRVALMAVPALYALVAVPVAFWRWRPAARWPALRRGDWRASPMRRWMVPTALAGVLGVAFIGRAPDELFMVLRRNVVVGAALELTDALLDDDTAWAHLAVRPLEPFTIAPGRGPARNLLVITLESVSAKATSLYADANYAPRQGTTPHLEALAREGALVERAYTVMPHTSKALVSIECGLYPKFTPAVAESEPGGIPAPCLPKLLREQGFATAFFQPAEENYEGRSNLVREFGFETFVGKESLDGAAFDEASYFGWEDDVLVDPVAKWIGAQRRAGKRFFASVLTLTAHHPYAVPRGYAAMPLVGDRMLNDYLNTVAYTDRFVRKLLDAVAREGGLDDTLVIVSGDHGEAFGEHGRYQHDTAVYEENVRIPMVLRGPGVRAGTRITGNRQIIDVLPTALEALGFVPSRAPLGRSLLSAEGHPRLYLHCYFQRRCHGFLEGRRKTIDNFRTRGMEVFDLGVDPEERMNLFGESPGVDYAARALRERMGELYGETNARYVLQAKARRDAFVLKEAPAVGRPLGVDYGFAEIVAAKLEPEVIAPGGKVEVTVVYRVKETPPRGTRTFMHVASGKRSANADHEPVGGAYPVSEWKPGDYVVDVSTVSTRPDQGLGTSLITTGFWSSEEGRYAPRAAGRARVRGNRVELGAFEVRGAAVNLDERVRRERPPLTAPVDVRFGKWVRLHEAKLDKPETKGGLKVSVDYVFEVLEDLGDDAAFVVELEGPSASRHDYVPLGGAHPLRAWKRGEFVVDRQGLITKTSDREGEYRVMLSLRVGGVPVAAKGEGLPVAPDGAVEVARFRMLPGSNLR